MRNQYIELNRSFHEIPKGELPEERFSGTQAFLWSDLLNEYRVIILSEAGSGKTWEIRNVTKKLRKEGKNAFFLRLEYISEGFDVAFEEGTSEGFERWMKSSEEGWFFLDSVDEVRLKGYNDFELALRKFSLKINSLLSKIDLF